MAVQLEWTATQDEAPHNSILRVTAFTSKSLSSAEKDTVTDKEALDILHWLQKFHHYYFAREESKSLQTTSHG